MVKDGIPGTVSGVVLITNLVLYTFSILIIGLITFICAPGLLIAFVFNFLQRISQITVTVFTYLSVGGKPEAVKRVWFVQAYSVVGSNCVPIPGAMGVSDYLLLDGFGDIMSNKDAVHLDFLARSLSFYSMIMICGIVVLLKYISINRNRNI